MCVGKVSIIANIVTVRYAYVTIHYEGTERDDEYTLAVRVWAKSLFAHGIKQDVIILVSENVRESTKQQFREIGCQIREIKNIENPYKKSVDRRRSYKNHFEYTLNKLHVWNMLDYERVIYMDADNIFFHNIDNLFKCGHFCAVYMNPCNFHTGLFVVTPSNETYHDLLKSLASLPSYDGADQGFLVAYFAGLQKAPLFDPLNPIPETELPKMQRLTIGYNNNHVFHYVEGAYDQFRVFGLKDSSEPFYSLTYAIAPILKPWFWWGYPILDMNWYWNDQRSLLHDNWWPSFLIRLFLMLSVVVGNSIFVKRLIYKNKNSMYPCSLLKVFKNDQSCGCICLYQDNDDGHSNVAHMALFLVVVYMYSWQWVVASYIKLLRPFSTSLLRSVTVPRYWYWCAAFAFGLYFGILAVFTFVYFLVKVSAYESIKVFQERIEETM
ncbi:glycosyl transferase [Blastocystis sp. subtype 4]|uniref:glycosyl transferase n=1 Tax=Blastocystis sp. subtype 4 TaxID=944170 RepID=UPI0007113097|nr:glycosyl transferase [Blastocystis sp. subtype 4]KNB46820.1 glycosyl transferase [Blastocystis sp. subtype 4]|eukprot:XP_014530263.1 glycosyl transferase [Blastocystis sp. subtype 4]